MPRFSKEGPLVLVLHQITKLFINFGNFAWSARTEGSRTGFWRVFGLQGRFARLVSVLGEPGTLTPFNVIGANPVLTGLKLKPFTRAGVFTEGRIISLHLRGDLFDNIFE